MKRLTLFTIGAISLAVGTAGYLLTKKNNKMVKELVSAVRKTKATEEKEQTFI